MRLHLSPERFSLGRLPPGEPVPAGEEVFFAATGGERSLLCPEDRLPQATFDAVRGYRLLRVAGKLPLETVGILSDLAGCLRRAEVPVLAQYTLDTDCLFVPESRLQEALNALRSGGHAVRRSCRIRELGRGEYETAVELVLRVFRIFEAPYLPPLGMENMLGYADADFLRSRGDCRLFGAFSAETLCGVMGTERESHIGLLFVDAPYHGQGVGRQLVEFLAEKQPYIDLNAAPFAYGFYRRMGFLPKGEEILRGGMRITPMERRNPE